MHPFEKELPEWHSVMFHHKNIPEQESMLHARGSLGSGIKLLASLFKT
jgi:hypothetical protein